MKVTKLQYSEGRTINVGNYNSARVEFGVEVELDPKDDVEESERKLKEMVREVVDEQTGEIMALVKKNSRNG